ncbi:MAG: SBBP repeat-containing protein [Pirellulales bacterium]
MATTFRALAASVILICGTSARAQSLEWAQQFGTVAIDHAASVVADTWGNIYVSGSTLGDLAGPNAGEFDAYVAKYDAAGGHQWTRQFGTDATDLGAVVSLDAVGNIYVSGPTDGSLQDMSSGGTDFYVRKYDAAGGHQWTRQFGTDATSEIFGGASTDGSGNTYLVGTTSGSLGEPNSGISDAFVRKYDSAGNLQWTRQFGTDTYDWGESVFADHLGSVYVTGATAGALDGTNAGNQDVFVRKYDSAGNLEWTRQFGSSDTDNGSHTSVDALGNLYISGTTFSSFGGTNAGRTDAFLTKYSAAGDVNWIRQFGTDTYDVGGGVITDNYGHVLVTGYTSGSLDGENIGHTDVYVRRYSDAGDLQWSHQFGTNARDEIQPYGSSISSDELGNIYVSGQTNGVLSGQFSGLSDAFLVKFSYAVPEPGCLSIALPSVVALGVMATRRGR